MEVMTDPAVVERTVSGMASSADLMAITMALNAALTFVSQPIPGSTERRATQVRIQIPAREVTA